MAASEPSAQVMTKLSAAAGVALGAALAAAGALESSVLLAEGAVELEEEEQALKVQARERAQKSARIVERLREAVLIGWSLISEGPARSPGQGLLR